MIFFCRQIERKEFGFFYQSVSLINLPVLGFQFCNRGQIVGCLKTLQTQEIFLNLGIEQEKSSKIITIRFEGVF